MNRSKHTNDVEQVSAIAGANANLLAPSLLALMADHDSPVEPVDGNTLRCWAVPISKEFSKPKTNLLATFRSSGSAFKVSADAALARRLVMLRVDEPHPHEVFDILRNSAAQSPIPVHPAAIDTAMRLADRAQHNNPAAAVGILSAAIAEAVWQNASQVGPDEVFAGRDLNQFPDQPEE